MPCKYTNDPHSYHYILTAFELLERKRYKMSWGPATGASLLHHTSCVLSTTESYISIFLFVVFIHRRLESNGAPVGPARLNILPSDSVEYDDDPIPVSVYSVHHL
jgi:hypothetical protein